MPSTQSLAHLFYRSAQRSGERPFLTTKRDGAFQTWTYANVQEKVRALAKALLDLGVRRGDRFGLISENRPAWSMSDLACLSIGAVDVPIYATSPTAEIEHILRDSQARGIFVSNQEQWDKVQGLVADLDYVILFDRIENPPSNAHFFQDLFERGRSQDDAALEQSLSERKREELATVLYTSGTTGAPKGVMLSHGNFLSNCESVLQHLEIQETDSTLSFLPLSHCFERTAGHYVMMAVGGEISYASSLEKVPQELREIRPTIILGVPRFFEKMHGRVVSAVEHSPYYRRKLFRYAMKVGARVFAVRNGDSPPSSTLQWRYEVVDRLVFSRLRERVGGRVRLLVSGGAPLDARIAEFFNHAGLPLVEGYGMTETSPVITCNVPGSIRAGTVGKVIPDVHVEIAEDGEILVRGSNVMQGYLGLPDATREVLEPDGTFHTGDVGNIDEHGFVSITDRKKDLIVSAGGKNISPQVIEILVKQSAFVGDLCLVGDRRPYVVALLVPDLLALKDKAKELGLEWTNRQDMLQHETIVNLLLDAVDTANRQLSPPEQIKRFTILHEPFSQESGELTPTLKVRRRVVEKRYQDQIEALYAAPGERKGSTPLLVPC